MFVSELSLQFSIKLTTNIWRYLWKIKIKYTERTINLANEM